MENNITYPDLDQIYKQYVTHTHEAALQAVYRAGLMAAWPNEDFSRELTLEEELAELQREHERLLLKYDALNAKFNVNQPKLEPNEALAEQKILISQAMGMGIPAERNT